MKDYVVLGILWSLFCLFHSLLASLWVKEKIEARLKKNFIYYRLFYTIFAFITFSIVVAYQANIPAYLLFQTTKLSIISGAIITLSGIIIMAICIRKYFMSLSGLKSLYLQEDASSKLMITGIHTYVRHPLYLGTFLAIWGFFIFYPSASTLIVNSIITVYTLIGIYWEEEKLVHQFGDSYRTYQKNVPALIPFLK